MSAFDVKGRLPFQVLLEGTQRQMQLHYAVVGLGAHIVLPGKGLSFANGSGHGDLRVEFVFGELQSPMSGSNSVEALCISEDDCGRSGDAT
jgi:hypothetical protein